MGLSAVCDCGIPEHTHLLFSIFLFRALATHPASWKSERRLQKKSITLLVGTLSIIETELTLTLKRL